jgi:hypothetical protein
VADEKPSKKAKKPDKPVSQSREQQDKKRERDMAEFGRQVEEGSVVIRKMTPAERKANPPRERPPKRRQSN